MNVKKMYNKEKAIWRVKVVASCGLRIKKGRKYTFSVYILHYILYLSTNSKAYVRPPIPPRAAHPRDQYYHPHAYLRHSITGPKLSTYAIYISCITPGLLTYISLPCLFSGSGLCIDVGVDRNWHTSFNFILIPIISYSYLPTSPSPKLHLVLTPTHCFLLSTSIRISSSRL